MTSLIGFLPLVLMTLLFCWFYRIASRQILKYAVAWKLMILFFVVLIPLGIFLSLLIPFENRALRLILGFILQLAAGTYFIGTFAVNKEKVRPGVAMGLRVTALSMTYQLLVLGALMALVSFLESNVRPS